MIYLGYCASSKECKLFSINAMHVVHLIISLAFAPVDGFEIAPSLKRPDRWASWICIQDAIKSLINNIILSLTIFNPEGENIANLERIKNTYDPFILINHSSSGNCPGWIGLMS